MEQKVTKIDEIKINTKLANFPIMFFAVIMGLGGLNLAYEKLNKVFEISDLIFDILRVLITALFFVITAIYLVKMVKFPKEVKKEFSHPIKINFFAAFAIALFLLSAMWQNTHYFYWSLFSLAIVLQTFLTFYTISFWINNNLLINHTNPAWFIPIVGNLVVVIASKNNYDFLSYYFSIGVFFWIVLFTIVFYRIIFHDQLAKKFMPTLFIIIAPPAVAFLGYLKMTGSFDFMAYTLLNLTMFFSFLILFMYKNFTKLKFFLSWWAFTFPTAAASMAFTRAYELTNNLFFISIAIAAFLALIVIICIVSYFTIKAILNGEICVEEGNIITAK